MLARAATNARGGALRRGLATAVRAALCERAEMLPTKAVVVTRGAGDAPGHEWNLAQLCDQSGAVGSGLLELVKPGQTVAAAVGSSAERIALQLGAASAGLRLADAGLGLTKEGLAKILKEQNASVLVVSPEQLSVVHEVLGPLGSRSAVQKFDQFPELKFVVQTGAAPVPGTHRFKDILVYYPLEDKLAELKDSDKPFLVTVDPKSGAVSGELTQKQALENSRKKSEEIKIKADSRVLFKAKKDVAANLCCGTLGCALHSALLVVPADQLDDSAVAQLKEKDNCSAVLA